VDWGAALALRNAYLQPRRDQINRELFKRGRLFFVKDTGQPTRCSMSAHPGMCLPYVGRGSFNSLDDDCRFKHLTRTEAAKLPTRAVVNPSVVSSLLVDATSSTPTSADAVTVAVSAPTSASRSVVPTPAAAAGPGKRAPVVIVAIDDYRISDRDVLELHTIWSDASTTWLLTRVDWGAAVALRNAYLQPRRDQINRELFERGRQFCVTDNGWIVACLSSVHPGKLLPDVGAPSRERFPALAAATPPSAAMATRDESDPSARRLW